MNIPLHGDDWRLRWFTDEAWRREGAVAPELALDRRWYRGTVPGSVAYDLWQAGEVPYPYSGTRTRELAWIADRTWVYRKAFTVPEAWRGRRLALVFEGIDYACQVFLNGELLGAHRSQFVPARFEVGDRVVFGGTNVVAVVLEPAPSLPSQHGRTSAVREHKTRMTYGWDFCPPLPHLGIWGEVALHAAGPARIEEVWMRPLLADDHRRAELRVILELSCTEWLDTTVTVRVRLDSNVVLTLVETLTLREGRMTFTLEGVLERPALWWPNGHGDQPLYEVEVRLGQSDACTAHFGVRSLAWAANATPDPAARPYTVVVNGHPIYLTGWNWLPTDLLYGVPCLGKLARLLALARRAHVTMLRLNGVGLIERQAFYNLCDQHGIMVWQEFIQSSSSIDRQPTRDPDFLALMQREAEGIVPRLRNHPSLALWCGGNELESLDFLPLGDEEPVLALLKKVVARLDPDRLWLPTSASGPMPYCGINTATHRPHIMHDVHGPWHHQGLTEQYTLFNRSRALLHSELGAEGLANLGTLLAVLPEAHRWPPAPDDPVWDHLGSSSWVRPDVWREAFGEIGDLGTLVRATQVWQAEAVRYAVEANRRRAFENSGSLPWTFNEPYPQPAGLAAVDYYARPKPLYYAVARAYAPVSVTARFASQVWDGRETFEAEIWGSVAGPRGSAGDLEVRLVGSSGQVHARWFAHAVLAANATQRLLEVSFPLTEVDSVFFLDLVLRDKQDRQLAANRYPFSRAANLVPWLALSPTTLEAEPWQEGFRLVNTGAHVALFVWLEDADLLSALPPYLSDNHHSLLPGEVWEVTVTPVRPNEGWRLSARGWNTAEYAVEHVVSQESVSPREGA